jgi:hypothetical protein
MVDNNSHRVATDAHNLEFGADVHRSRSTGKPWKQSRQAEYDRLTALPRWVRTGEIVRCESNSVSERRRNETRTLT